MAGNFELSDRELGAGVLIDIPASSGARVRFDGVVRSENEGRPVTGLEYSAYEELAIREGLRILEEARLSFGFDEARAVHRVGNLRVGEVAVVVEVVSGHRGECFDACRWIIDQIKTRVPIWKKEIYAEGDAAWLDR